MMQSPDATSKKDNKKSTKKDNAPPVKKDGGQQPLSLLKDLPSLGGKKQQAPSNQFDDFDEFDDEEQQKSVIGGGVHDKYSKAEQHLQDFYKEEKEGYGLGGSKNSKKFQVQVYGMPQANAELDEDEISEEIEEEEINTDRDNQYLQVPDQINAITVS